MKHGNSTLNTKKALASSLKKIVQKKPFSKVTVGELVSDCGLNRNTFYYHFENINDLLKWTLEQEIVEIVKPLDLTADYKDAVCLIMDYIEENDQFLNNICRSVAQEELKRFLYADFIELSRLIIDQTEEFQNISVPEDYKVFLSEFHTEAVAGILIRWITDPAVRNREKMIEYISVTMHSTIPTALQAISNLKKR